MQKITHKNDLKFLILKKISDLLYLSIVNDNEENKEILFQDKEILQVSIYSVDFG